MSEEIKPEVNDIWRHKVSESRNSIIGVGEKWVIHLSEKHGELCTRLDAFIKR
tara:strand:+ start:644 stop:802 length:159 start_codon:yes stop_codon:yes gene_type:complete